jgi:large subunit ribosomal protein L4
MAKVKIYNLEGKEKEVLEVSDAVFGLAKNDDLVHQVFVSQYANRRHVIADTKTRGERAGSGIKPWKQKGTGRARVGSSRTPTWRGGGVAFGPTNDRNFKKKINKKVNNKAIALVLTGKLKDSELIVLEKIEAKENKTKAMAAILKSLNVKGRMLIAFSEKEKDIKLASRNIEKVQNISIKQLNVYDMLNNKNLILSKDSVKYLEEKYMPKAEEV